MLTTDPQFVDAADGNSRLQPSSPCVDGGDFLSTPGREDVIGQPWVLNGDSNRFMVIDIGAFEFLRLELVVRPSDAR